MATLKKYDLTGKDLGEVQIEDGLLGIEAHPQLVKDYLVILRNNQRQWNACTQTRAEVNHSTKKPYAQKGTGNARQGFLGSPQFRGGGRVHAPRTKFDQNVQLNRKEKRLAVRHLLSEKIKESEAHILKFTSLKAPKTKTIAQFIEALNLSGKRILFLAEKGSADYTNLAKSLRNIPKVEFTYFPNVNGYDLALCHNLIILESGLEELKASLGGSK